MCTVDKWEDWLMVAIISYVFHFWGVYWKQKFEVSHLPDSILKLPLRSALLKISKSNGLRRKEKEQRQHGVERFVKLLSKLLEALQLLLY